MEQETKRSFIIGVLVFIFCSFFIQPIMNFIVPKFLSICSYLSSFFCNILYEEASKMDKNTFSEAFFTMFIGGAFYLGIFALILTCSKENKIKRALQKPKRSIFILINIIYLLLLSFLTTAKYSDYYLNLRFDRKMKILGPVLSGKQEKELIAQWATMKSYHDYLMIENTLNNFAQNNNIVEPKSLWKKSK